MEVLKLECLFLVFFCCMNPAVVIYAQDSQEGFISIDCGAPKDSNYTDAATGINYISDAGLIDTGVIYPIPPAHSKYIVDWRLLHLRSFPEGIRNCYTLRPAKGKFNKYLIRATFLYGDYDGENKLPQFDIHLGADYWYTVKITNASLYDEPEAIYVPSSDILYVCLENTGHGTPFISSLELRPLNNSMYGSVSGSLSLFARFDFGNSGFQPIRYKDDSYDRVWLPATFKSQTIINTTAMVDSPTNYLRPPPVVMSTASTPLDSSKPLTFWWSADYLTDRFLVYMYFAELQKLEANQSRQFNMYLNGEYYSGPVTPPYLRPLTLFSKVPETNRTRYDFLLNKTENSTLPPIINALEIYKFTDISHSQTEDQDTVSMLSIKSAYSISRNWQGDPCAPQAFVWDGLNCSYNGSNPPRIISLNMSSFGVTGSIPLAISNLTMLQTLDLSNNKLTGQIPNFLEELESLKVLNLKGNNFTGPIPSKLLEKSQGGVLLLSADELGDNADPCKFNQCRKKRNVVVPFIASMSALLVLLISLAVLWKIRRGTQGSQKKSDTSLYSLELNNRQFTYSEILKITNNLETLIGKGGFGKVYLGYIDSSKVAVKMFTSTLDEGFKELLSEANVLMNVHHKNITSLVGYCIDGNYVGIIYEFMANGDLRGHLSGKNLHVLSWQDRLQIAKDAAQGLEYLHHGVKRAIVHRDVKSTNILLDDKFSAKIADFGLSRAFPVETATHVSTTYVAGTGTPGYLDPKQGYQDTGRLTEKSDVYSFGVVLVEIITGKPAIEPNPPNPPINLVRWVCSVLRQGDVKDVLDPRLTGEFDIINSAWKAVRIAMACLSHDSTERPTMTHVVTELKQCLAMEMAMQESKSTNFVSCNTSITEPDRAFDREERSSMVSTALLPYYSQTAPVTASAHN